MKRFVSLTFVLVLALSMAVQPTTEQLLKMALYWFQLDAAGNQIAQANVPVALTQERLSRLWYSLLCQSI